MIDVALLTAEAYLGNTTAQVDVADPEQYVRNVRAEDELLTQALQQQDLVARPVAWTDSEFDWAAVRAAVFRTTWDYVERLSEFRAFLNRVSGQTLCINQADLLRWNLDKTYLRDLAEQGIPITPTRFIECGNVMPLAAILDELAGADHVVKPVTSAGGRHTYRLDTKNLTELEPIFRSVVAQEAMMLQPFMQSVVSRGEVSLVVIDGHCTHGVLKRARQGDFRVQDDYGGTLHAYRPAKSEIAFAERVVATCSTRPIYARVDYVFGNQGSLDGSDGSDPLLQELELIEPELWFRKNPDAAAQMAAAIRRQIATSGG